MTTKTLRLPEELVAAERGVVGARENTEGSTALRKLLRLGYELHLADQYRQSRLSVREVARWLRLSVGDTLDRLQWLGVTGNVSAADTLGSLRSLGGGPPPAAKPARRGPMRRRSA